MKRTLCVLLVLLFSSFSFAQVTSVIQGKVFDENGQVLPGVVVEIESEKMIGKRSDVSRENGEFVFQLIPPGTYSLTATMTGMQTVKITVAVALSQTARPKVVMKPDVLSDVLTVTASSNPILDTNTVAAQFDDDFLEVAAVGRDQENVALLSPGVVGRYNDSNFGGAPSISGAPSNGNTYLVNGADSRFDNVRSDAANTVIEDAIQETTVLTAGVSAEFGQFSGGVISTITKSGGNKFSGSFRSALTNADWIARNPLELEDNIEKEDKVNHVETITLGGPIIKDRLWFFLAGERSRLTRDSNFATARSISSRAAESYGITEELYVPGIRKVPGREDERDNYELKLSGQIAQGHDFFVSYQDREDLTINSTSSSFDITSVATRTITREALSVNYRGALTSSLSLDLMYTDRDSVFSPREIPPHLQGRDLAIFGTQLRNRRGGARTNSPTFLGKPVEPRGNETLRAKLNYFWSTDTMGSHNIVFGLQDAKDTRFADNRQFANDWQFRSDWRFDAAGNPIPIFSNTRSGGRYQSLLYYQPIEVSSQTYKFKVQSAYLNDVWDLNDKFRFNIGFRFDKNDATDQQGTPVADDSHISPRLSVNWDLFGNRKHQFSASYSEYVQRTSEAADDGSQAGSTSLAILRYRGPQTENFLDVINWINETYGEGFFQDPLNHPNRAQWEADLRTNRLFESGSPNTVIGSVGANGGGVRGSLDSLVAKEIRLGYTHDWGSRGFVKTDFVFREFENFAVSNINRNIGPTNNGNSDLVVINNDDSNYEREYNAVQLQGAFRITDNLSLTGNYTWAQLTGNVEGSSSSGVGSTIGRTTEYPELNNFDRRNPVGYLSNDVRHRANLFLNYNLSTGIGNFTFSAMEEINSGSPYNRAWSLDLDEFDGQYGLPELDSLGYVSPDDSSFYYLSIGEDRGETAYATNLGVNWDIKLFKKFEFFLQLDVFNLFNQNAADNGRGYRSSIEEVAAFNVFNETPVEGVHYELDRDFGRPTSSIAFQRPRTLQIDLGFRF